MMVSNIHAAFQAAPPWFLHFLSSPAQVCAALAAAQAFGLRMAPIQDDSTVSCTIHFPRPLFNELYPRILINASTVGLVRVLLKKLQKLLHPFLRVHIMTQRSFFGCLGPLAANYPLNEIRGAT